MPSSRSLRSQSSSAGMGRNPPPPAAGTAYPVHGLQPQRANSINSGSQSSLSPNVTPTESTSGSSFVFVGHDNPHHSADSFQTFDSSKAGSFQNSLRRPNPPPLKHSATDLKTTTTDPRAMTPALRQSASFSNGDSNGSTMIPARSDGGSSLISKRHSDESNGVSSNRKASRWGKKKGISGVIDSMLGSPRKIEISAPENPIHLTHVGYDNDTGQFTVSQRIITCWAHVTCCLRQSLIRHLRQHLAVGHDKRLIGDRAYQKNGLKRWKKAASPVKSSLPILTL